MTRGGILDSRPGRVLLEIAEARKSFGAGFALQARSRDPGRCAPGRAWGRSPVVLTGLGKPRPGLVRRHEKMTPRRH